MTDYLALRVWRDMRMGMELQVIGRVGPLSINGVEQRRFMTADGPPVDTEQNALAPVLGLLGDVEAQQLANDLWEAGVRPEQARMGQGVTTAIGNHLHDMRAIVAAKLGVPLP